MSQYDPSQAKDAKTKMPSPRPSVQPPAGLSPHPSPQRPEADGDGLQLPSSKPTNDNLSPAAKAGEAGGKADEDAADKKP